MSPLIKKLSPYELGRQFCERHAPSGPRLGKRESAIKDSGAAAGARRSRLPIDRARCPSRCQCAALFPRIARQGNWCLAVPPLAVTSSSFALKGDRAVATAATRPDLVLGLHASLCRHYPPATVERVLLDPLRSSRGISKADLVHARVPYYASSGHEQHAKLTHGTHAMSLIYAVEF